MINREKTIRELETLRVWHAHHYNQFHNECAATIQNALELLKEHENQLTMQYEEGFHDGYKQAMRESTPCYECQEFYCDDCKFKDNRKAKWDAAD